MKKFEIRANDELFISIVEYAFTEWLVRRRIFAAFESNYCQTPSGIVPFRDRLRSDIKFLFRHPDLGLGSLLSTAFSFPDTPEGIGFWRGHSKAWRHFYADFRGRI